MRRLIASGIWAGMLFLLLESLKAADLPATAPAGSIEAMVDDLVHVSGNSFEHSADSEFWNDPRLVRLALKGFDAVPTLIAHLNDRRLSKATWTLTRFAGAPPVPEPIRLNVGDIAGYILAGMAGASPVEKLEVAWFTRTIELPWPDIRTRLSPNRGTAIEHWWSAAKAHGEEAYLASNAFPPASDGRRRRPFVLIFQILAARYPARLPEVFGAMITDNARPLTRNQSNSDIGTLQRDFESAAAALSQSRLPRDQRIALLIRASDSTSPFLNQDEFRNAANLMLEHYNTNDVARVRASIPHAP